MTAYVINRFATVTLPTFDAGWKARCESCKWCSTRDSRADDYTGISTSMRCANPQASLGHYTACIDARERKCGPSAQFWEAA